MMSSAKISTRTRKECERLVALWDAGKHDQVRAVLGEPHPDFLTQFRAVPVEKAGSPERKPRRSR